ncbi:MAG TPA: hypothetical protein VLH85_10315 [Levilinea sp.]|nr:hypothetical protein [Levilinea sp.]
MKRNAIIISLMLAMVLLAGCFPAPDVTTADADMATRVAAILTEMPTGEGATPPEEPVAATPEEVEVTQAPTDTPEATPTEEILPPTETPLPSPTAVPTETPMPDATTMPAIPLFTATQPAAANPTPTPPATLTPGVVPPVSTPVAPGSTDPRNRLGAPSSTDPMNNATTWNWPSGVNPFTSIDFRDGAMRLTGLTEDAGWRLPLLPSTTNLYIEMTAYSPSCSGRDNFGIIFRVPVMREADRGYLFSVSCDGRYNLWMWDGKEGLEGKATTLIGWKTSAVIQSGSNATNRIGVMTYDDRLILYINGVKVDEIKDKTYVAGNFGVFVNPDSTENYTIVIDEMNYWTNPTP